MLFPGCDWNRWSSHIASAAAPADCLPASAAALACDSPPSPASGSAQTTPAGIRSAADAPPRSSGSATAPPSPLPPDTARRSCGSTLPDSPPLYGTSSPRSNRLRSFLLPALCLAHALLPRSGRRPRPANASALPASRLDLVQGTAQKIPLQYLPGQNLLQLLHFRHQRLLPPPVRSQQFRIQLLLPSRQTPTVPSQIRRHFRQILSCLHPGHRRQPELQPASLRSLQIRHSQLLSCSVGILSLSHFWGAGHCPIHGPISL